MKQKAKAYRMTATARAAAMMAFQLWQQMWAIQGHQTTAPFAADGDYAGEIVQFMRRLDEENARLRNKIGVLEDRLNALGEDPDML